MRRTILIGLVFITVAASAWAKPCLTPTLQDLSENWVGEAGGAYFHLRLGVDGAGLLAIESTEGRVPSAYYVRSTKIDKQKITFVIEPAAASVEPIFLRGSCCGGHLYLVAGSLRPNWKWNVSLRPSRVLSERLQATTQAITALGLPPK
jgi:hypothetical protein